MYICMYVCVCMYIYVYITNLSRGRCSGSSAGEGERAANRTDTARAVTCSANKKERSPV